MRKLKIYGIISLCFWAASSCVSNGPNFCGLKSYGMSIGDEVNIHELNKMDFHLDSENSDSLRSYYVLLDQIKVDSTKTYSITQELFVRKNILEGCQVAISPDGEFETEDEELKNIDSLFRALCYGNIQDRQVYKNISFSVINRW